MNLSIEDFDYELPSELIAQHPSETRSGSRLLCVGASLVDRRFFELPQLLAPGDLLVFNDTRVIKARLAGEKASGGRVGARRGGAGRRCGRGAGAVCGGGACVRVVAWGGQGDLSSKDPSLWLD